MNLKVQKRDTLGKKVKNLRKEGLIPAEIFGNDFENKHVSIEKNKFKKAYQKAGKTTVIDINIEGEKSEKIPVLIQDIQLHPISRTPLAIDFYKVDTTKKLQTEVPLELVGEAPAEKEGLIVVRVTNNVEVESLPHNIPDKVEVDVSGLEDVSDNVYVKDLEVPSNVEIVTEPKTVVVSVSEKVEEEEEDVLGEALFPGELEDMAEGESPLAEELDEGEMPAQGAEGAPQEGQQTQEADIGPEHAEGM